MSAPDAYILDFFFLFIYRFLFVAILNCDVEKCRKITFFLSCTV